MDKITITKAQAEAIEAAITEFGKDRVIDGVLGEWRGELSPLNDLRPSEFARIMYGAGYEVEETFEVGDAVVLKSGQVVEITEEGSDPCKVVMGWIANGSMYRDEVRISFIARHATEQEKWWAKHGRKVWELKENDLLYYDDEFKEVEEVTDIGAIMLSSERVYIPTKTIKNKYSVACFAEDRKDIDGGDIE